MSSHDHLLFTKLLSYILSTRSRDVDPGLGEESTRSEHKDDIDDAMEWVLENVPEGFRGRQVIAQTTSWETTVAASVVGPCTEEIDQDVSSELGCQHLRDNVKVRNQSGLEDDGDVGGVEELDRV